MHGLVLDVVLTAATLWSSVLTVRRILSERTTEGLSLGLMLLTLFATATWTFNGIERAQVAQAISNAFAAGAWLVGLTVAVVFDKRSVTKIIGAVVVCGVVTAFGYVFAGSYVLGMLAMTWAVIGKIPQFRESWIRPGGVAVSLGAFGIAIVQSIAWALYGLAHGDWFVVATASYATTWALFVLIRTVQGRRRAGVAVQEVEVVPAIAA